MTKLYQISLQNQFTYALGGFGVFIAILIISFGIYLNEELEAEVWRSTLDSEYLNYLNHRKGNAGNNVIEYGNLKIYEVDKKQLLHYTLPPELSSLPLGIHDEVKIKNKEYIVLIRDLDGKRIFICYDISYLEETEFYMGILFIGVLISFFVLILYLSRTIGRLLAAPVKNMANVVSNLNPEQRGLRIGDDYKEYELSMIAKAIDTYLIKMDAFVNREKDFIDTASHELRTPIAIISGAVDVLNAHPEAASVSERALSRIKQSTKDIAESINALFILSKDETQIANSAEAFQLGELLDRIVSDHLSIFPEKNITMESSLDKTCLFAPKEATSIVLRNLVRNAIEYSKNHEIRIILKHGILRIENQSEYITPENVAQLYNKHVRGEGGGGSGIGLYLINRICDTFNWKLDISSHEDKKFIVLLDVTGNIIPDDEK